MSTVTVHRLLALLGYVSCLAAAPALAQMGPIQPVLVTDGKVEHSHDRPDIGDFTVPVEVHVDASGAITNVTGQRDHGKPAGRRARRRLHARTQVSPRPGRKGRSPSTAS